MMLLGGGASLGLRLAVDLEEKQTPNESRAPRCPSTRGDTFRLKGNWSSFQLLGSFSLSGEHKPSGVLFNRDNHATLPSGLILGCFAAKEFCHLCSCLLANQSMNCTTLFCIKWLSEVF